MKHSDHDTRENGERAPAQSNSSRGTKTGATFPLGSIHAAAYESFACERARIVWGGAARRGARNGFCISCDCCSHLWHARSYRGRAHRHAQRMEYNELAVPAMKTWHERQTACAGRVYTCSSVTLIVLATEI